MFKPLSASGAPALLFKLYPTGEFSATRVRETPSLGLDDLRDAYKDATEHLSRKDAHADRPTADFVISKLSPLGSSNVPNSHKIPKVRGRRGMTRYNKRLIVNSVTLLERKYGKKCLSFLTLTLPPDCESRSPDLYAECKRQMLQWLQRSLIRCGLPTEVIGCTEVQSNRLAQSNQFALHEHWVFKGREAYKGWGIPVKAFADAWIRILVNVYELGAFPESSRSSTRVESIKKSAAAYLAKYVSKGEKCVAALIADGYENFLPHAWVTKTKEMLNLFKRSIVRLRGEAAIFLSDSLRKFRENLCRWSKDIFIDFDDGGQAWLGFCGYLNKDGWKLVGLTGT